MLIAYQGQNAAHIGGKSLNCSKKSFQRKKSADKINLILSRKSQQSCEMSLNIFLQGKNVKPRVTCVKEKQNFSIPFFLFQ